MSSTEPSSVTMKSNTNPCLAAVLNELKNMTVLSARLWQAIKTTTCLVASAYSSVDAVTTKPYHDDHDETIADLNVIVNPIKVALINSSYLRVNGRGGNEILNF